MFNYFQMNCIMKHFSNRSIVLDDDLLIAALVKGYYATVFVWVQLCDTRLPAVPFPGDMDQLRSLLNSLDLPWS